jgi:hypothetical protein
MAARTAAAKPRRPTPAIPASPPVLVSIPSSLSGTDEAALSPGLTASMEGGGANGDSPGGAEAEGLIPGYDGPELMWGIGGRAEAPDAERPRLSTDQALVGGIGLNGEVV